MSLCALCANSDVELCSYHHFVPVGDDWAASNRAMCDFLHRGIVLPRVTERGWWETVLEPVGL